MPQTGAGVEICLESYTSESLGRIPEKKKVGFEDPLAYKDGSLASYMA
jgi:hypothetical protein